MEWLGELDCQLGLFDTREHHWLYTYIPTHTSHREKQEKNKEKYKALSAGVQVSNVIYPSTQSQNAVTYSIESTRLANAALSGDKLGFSTSTSPLTIDSPKSVGESIFELLVTIS